MKVSHTYWPSVGVRVCVHAEERDSGEKRKGILQNECGGCQNEVSTLCLWRRK